MVRGPSSLVVGYWRTICSINRFKNRRVRALVFALSGAKVPTLETRVDSTINAGNSWEYTGYERYEYDPILTKLLSARRGPNAIQKARIPLARPPGVREVIRRVRQAKTCLHYVSVLGRVEPPFNISAYAEIRTPHQVSLDTGAVIRDGTILNGRSTTRKFGLECGTDFYVKEFAYLDPYNGYIKVGRGAAIAQGCAIHGNGGVEIGDYLMMGRDAMILAGNHGHRLNKDVPFIMQGSGGEGIKIGCNVWLGAGSIVLDGVQIGDNVVVGAGSIVAQSVPSNSLVIGRRELNSRSLMAETTLERE